MKREELQPFIGRPVVVRIAGSDAVTGILHEPEAGDADRYAVVSVDGEMPPVYVDVAHIEGIDS